MNDDTLNPPLAPDGSAPSVETLNLDGRTVTAAEGLRWITDAWTLFKRRPLQWIGLALLYMVIECALSFAPVFNLLSMLVTPILLGGLMFTCEQFRADGDVRIGGLFTGFTRKLGPLALVGALTFAIVIIGVVVLASIIGFDTFAQLVSHQPGNPPQLGASSLVGLLIYIAIVTVAVAAAWFAPALVILHDVAPIRAMRASFKGVMRNWLAGIVYALLLLVMLVVGALPFLLGWLIVLPLLFLSVYVGYRDVFIIR
ncbi:MULTISPECIES: BPSS1780 family membrane protein [Burkholderiaceae]|uniref:BPSS1780 family membrane protein n=1 Tax=Burkholderiaceae TaxID=119060 RepID=UPI00095F111E|nr:MULTISPECIES: BPSS1780 family membrane protein [Burkholderiaceae]MCF2135108.1 hypothetical protein [Mycetohabitans sp. B3]MCG1040430.1 hypothetical protein [Mycetohabitans sp. B7]SIT74870.1 hypothetical protein SAMN04487769_2443 [Burkholderia sp. b14]